MQLSFPLPADVSWALHNWMRQHVQTLTMCDYSFQQPQTYDEFKG